jgi:predicted DNA binding CopG/RHH family protein
MSKKTQKSYDPRFDDSLLELTPFEQDIEDNFEHQIRVENYDETKEMILEAAKNYHATKKMISIRVQEADLI